MIPIEQINNLKLKQTEFLNYFEHNVNYIKTQQYPPIYDNMERGYTFIQTMISNFNTFIRSYKLFMINLTSSGLIDIGNIYTELFMNKVEKEIQSCIVDLGNLIKAIDETLINIDTLPETNLGITNVMNSIKLDYFIQNMCEILLNQYDILTIFFYFDLNKVIDKYNSNCMVY